MPPYKIHLYPACLTHNDSGQQLEGYVTATKIHDPSLTIPLCSGLIRHQPSDQAVIRECLSKTDWPSGKKALEGIMARRNLEVLGYDEEKAKTGDVFGSLPFPVDADVNKVTFTTVGFYGPGCDFPNRAVLILADKPFTEPAQDDNWSGLDLCSIEGFARRLNNRLRGEFSLEPIDFTVWREGVLGNLPH